MPVRGRWLALARLWKSFWGRAAVVAKTEHYDTDRSSSEARARFWTEFREGQREAEAHSSRSR